MYKLIKIMDFDGTYKEVGVLRLLDNASIPFDPANTDYQAYLEWLNAGNTPDPAEEVQGETA